jgi:hypothetical protein
MLSYQLNLRSNLSDNSLTGSDGDETTSYRRSLEPALDIIFGNPVYNLTAGYQRQEEWDTARISDEGRETEQFYYARFNASPYALPSLNIQFDHQENNDYLDESLTDDSRTVYSIGSTYTLPTDVLRFRYSVNYAHSVDRTPLNAVISKTENDSFNGNYSIGYGDSLLQRKLNYTLTYKGFYSRSKNKQFALQAGSVLNERTPLSGLHGQGNTTQSDVDVLTSQADFIDENLATASTVNIGTGAANRFHNLGILVSSQANVDRIFIYVDRDVSGDIVLNNRLNWRAMTSNFNTTGTWTDITIDTVTITTDTANNEFVYEIKFLTPQSASFYKVINLQASSISNVFVTEVEAYGTDSADEAVQTRVDTTFNQGVNFNTTYRPVTRLIFGVDYSLDRNDTNPVSVERTLGGFVENLFSNSVRGEKEGFRSNITRHYGATTTWLTHQYLTTTLRLNRSESFDNLDQTDTRLESYSLLFTSAPLPSLDTSLSLIRSDTYLFDEKDSTSDSVLLSVGAKLYRDVNMITDINFIKVRSLTSDETSTSQQVSGSLDAVLRRNLSGNLSYDFNWTDSAGLKTDTQQGSVILTYRPGRFISINGSFAITDADGEVTMTEGVLVDWLPLRAVRLNLNYQHSDEDTGSVTTDTVNGYVIWYVTQFADLRFTSGYTTRRAETTVESYNLTTNLNCRF